MIKIKHIHSDAAHTSHTLCSRHRLLIHHFQADMVPVFTLMPIRCKIPLSACTPLTQRPPRENASTHSSPSTQSFPTHSRAAPGPSGQLSMPNKMMEILQLQWCLSIPQEGATPLWSCVVPLSAHSFTSTSLLSLMV